MPLIKPPSDYGIPEPQLLEDAPEIDNQRVLIFLNVKPWICPKCGLTNFGRNENCANFRCKSPRPTNFKLEPKNVQSIS